MAISPSTTPVSSGGISNRGANGSCGTSSIGSTSVGSGVDAMEATSTSSPPSTGSTYCSSSRSVPSCSPKRSSDCSRDRGALTCRTTPEAENDFDELS